MLFNGVTILKTKSQYIINADFLTTANREGVDENSGWNKRLADSVGDAFCKSIHYFNQCDNRGRNLRYTWLFFLNDSSTDLSDFWDKIFYSVLNKLKRSEILLSRQDTLRTPESLTFLDWAQNRHSRPLFGHSDDFVSKSYHKSVRHHLVQLGVKTPDVGWLKRQLRLLGDRLHDSSHNDLWQEDLAEAVLDKSGISDIVSVFDGIRIIPMQDGSWQCAPSPNALTDAIYFPTVDDVQVPSGIDIDVVSMEAVASPSRKRLFKLLGVKECEIEDIVEKIRCFHQDLKAQKKILGRLEVGTLKDHVRYLYDVRNMVDNWDSLHLEQDILFWSAECRIYKGDRLYLADLSELQTVDRGYQLKSLFKDYTRVRYLHQTYLDQFRGKERQGFRDWLSRVFGIESIPRLRDSETGSLHSDFRWLLQDRSDQALDILRLHWSEYKQIVDPKDIEATEAIEEINKEIKKTKVRCQASTFSETRELRTAFAPSNIIIEEITKITGSANCALLALPSGHVDSWKFLKHFGVGFDRSLKFYLWMLGQKDFKAQRSRKVAKSLYVEIQRYATERDHDKYVR